MDVRFRAMGSACHVVVTGPPALLDVARTRLADLEGRWSRFLPASEVSALNAAPGVARAVSAETYELVSRAVDGWRRTGGAFDPTVLGDVVRAGYDRSFESLRGVAGASDLGRGAGAIELDPVARTVRLPDRVGFDPGGIGKGLAADLVTRELLAAGADGACVNVGGDVRVAGAAPGGAWLVAVEHPGNAAPVAVVALLDGAVATSTTRLRAWTAGGEARHHLIDPATGRPYAGATVAVSVVAGEAAWAEVVSKAALLAAPADITRVVEALGGEALVAFAGGGEVRTPGWPRPPG